MDHMLEGRKMVKALGIMAGAIGRTGFSLTERNHHEDALLLDEAFQLGCHLEFLSLIAYRRHPNVAAMIKAGQRMKIWKKDASQETGLGVISKLPQFEWRTENFYLFRKEVIGPNRVKVRWVTPEAVVPQMCPQDWYYIAQCDEMEYVTRCDPFPQMLRVSHVPGSMEATIEWRGEMVELV